MPREAYETSSHCESAGYPSIVCLSPGLVSHSKEVIPAGPGQGEFKISHHR